MATDLIVLDYRGKNIPVDFQRLTNCDEEVIKIKSVFDGELQKAYFYSYESIYVEPYDLKLYIVYGSKDKIESTEIEETVTAIHQRLLTAGYSLHYVEHNALYTYCGYEKTEKAE